MPLPRLDAVEVATQPLLQLLDVARPGGQPVLHRLLRGDQLLSEACRRGALSLGDVSATLLGDTALLCHEHGKRLGAETGECPLELFRALVDLERDDCVELRLSTRDLVVENARTRTHTRERERRSRGCDA